MKVMAALLTRMSRRPKCATVRATMRTTSSSWARLVGTARPRPPAAAMRATVRSSVPGVFCGAASVERAAQATAAPASASATAVAAPTPRLAPVTSATFPARSIRVLLSAGDDFLRVPHQPQDDVAHDAVDLVRALPRDPARVGALEHAGELEPGEDDVVVEVVERAARAPRVALRQLGASRETLPLRQVPRVARLLLA